MSKIKFGALLLAIVFVAASAFTNSKQSSKAFLFDKKYQVAGTDGTYYVLGDNLTGVNPGPTTYECIQSSNDCTIEVNSSDIVTRNGHQEISMAASKNLILGDFHDNR